MRIKHRMKKKWKVFFSAYIGEKIIKTYGEQKLGGEIAAKDEGKEIRKKVLAIVEHTLTEQLPNELKSYYELDVKDVKILGSENGSLIVFFSLILSVYSIISDYEGFLNSVKLIERHTRRILLKVFTGHISSDWYNRARPDIDDNIIVETENSISDFNEDDEQLGQPRFRNAYGNPLYIALLLFSFIELIFIVLMGIGLFKLISLLLEHYAIR